MKAFTTFLFSLLMLEEKTRGFTIDHALTLSNRLQTMMAMPKYEYLPKLRKYLNLYTGVLSYITLKLEKAPIDKPIKEFYMLGQPLFMKVPIEDKYLAMKKAYKWNSNDLEMFLDELSDAKKVWAEFSKLMESKVELGLFKV